MSVSVAVAVGARVRVLVAVELGVGVLVDVGVRVGVNVGVDVSVGAGVLVRVTLGDGVIVNVRDGVVGVAQPAKKIEKQNAINTPVSFRGAFFATRNLALAVEDLSPPSGSK